MMEALTVILLCQLAGELAVAATGVPLPGPVVGMLLLLVGLGIRGAVPGGLARTAGALVSYNYINVRVFAESVFTC